jgi:hypothetical protein
MQFTKLTRPYVTDIREVLETLYPEGNFTAITVTVMQISPARKAYMDHFWQPALDVIMLQAIRELWSLGGMTDGFRTHDFKDFFRYLSLTSGGSFNYEAVVNRLQDVLYGVILPDVFLDEMNPPKHSYDIVVLYHDHLSSRVRFFVLKIDEAWPARFEFFNIYQANRMLAEIRGVI